jgi:hypothetical protein
VLSAVSAVSALFAGATSAAAQDDPPGLAAPLAEPVWLCRPGAEPNPCAQDRDGTGASPFRARYPESGKAVRLDTVSTVDGTRTPFVAPDAPPVDCFYVYPTVDALPNPLLQVGDRAPRPTDTEFATLLSQVGPLLSGCRMFAPVYRQTPLPGLLVPALTRTPADFRLGQVDVVQAWRHYWAEDNRDPATGARRGVLLLGHSQGTAALITLIRTVIAPDPEQRAHVVSAMLLGGDVDVDTSSGVTGVDLPACVRRGDAVPTGCVVAWSAYRQPPGKPLPPDAAFGRSTVPGRRILCTNAAALLSGATPDATTPADLRYASRELLAGGGAFAGLLTGRTPPDVPGGYASYPGLVTARCASSTDAAGTADWLQVEGPDDVVGAPKSGGIGLHVLDWTVELGDLTELARRQSAAWVAGRG